MIFYLIRSSEKERISDVILILMVNLYPNTPQSPNHPITQITPRKNLWSQNDGHKHNRQTDHNQIRVTIS